MNSQEPTPEPEKVALPDGTVGVPYSATVKGPTNISEPYYTIYDSTTSPPSGLTLNERTGEISGTPQQAGTWELRCIYVPYSQVDDTLLGVGIVTDYTLTISEPEVTKLPGGVKYVPYNSEPLMEVPEGSTGHIELTEGILPSGLYLDTENYVITGIPMAAGTWTFTLMTDEVSSGGDISVQSNGRTELTCSITIADNTDSAVQHPNDYEIIIPVGEEDPRNPNHFLKDSYTEEELVIDGPFQEFMELYIDGIKLTRDVDYTAREGSTVITVRSQTFQRFGETNQSR